MSELRERQGQLILLLVAIIACGILLPWKVSGEYFDLYPDGLMSTRSTLERTNSISEESAKISALLHYVEDKDLDLDIVEIRGLESDAWAGFRENSPDLRDFEYPYWLHAKFQIKADVSQQWYLRVKYGLINDLQAYVFVDDLLVSSVATGALRAFDERSYPHRDFVFPFSLGLQ